MCIYYSSQSMNIGLYISASQNTTYKDAITQASLADELGFSSVWLTEKHFDQGHLLWSSPLMTASFMAAKTQRIKIGFAACVSTLYHPVRLAEDFANLDVLSGGRLIVGLTRTSLSEYYHEVFQSPMKKSWEKFDEQFEIMCQLWRNQFNKKYSGHFYKIPAVKLYPPLVQKPLPPLFFIAGNDDSIIDAARKGVGIFLHAFQTIDSVQAKKKLYENHFSDALGLGPRIILSRFVYVGAHHEQAIADIEAPFMRFLAEEMPKVKPALEKEYKTVVDFDFMTRELTIFGDATHCLNKLKSITQATGIQDFTMIVNLTTMDHQKSLESMRQLAHHIFPSA
jgi:alkanesulfonate monooxygenase SsuD/methylene tetrahydromethanopterin reductase-like flavin-dependent oxidoreductase (luciferase family)